jgi:hypothetical protein
MLRKLFAVGLGLVMVFGLSMADRASSQDKSTDKGGRASFVDHGTTPANLDQLVQELKNVRAQKAELDRREQQLMAAIGNKINEERQQLDQKIELRRRQLEEIERLIHVHAPKDGKTVDPRALPK